MLMNNTGKFMIALKELEHYIKIYLFNHPIHKHLYTHTHACIYI